MDWLKQKFVETYHLEDHIRCFYAPGRINLIGEHIDYNGGFVLPAAISLGTYGAARKRTDLMFSFYSSSFMDTGVIIVDGKALSFDEKHGWANYVKGILFELKQRGYHINHGFDLYVDSTLPIASGLSSSASLELLILYICHTFYDLNISREDMAKIAQHVENHYIGVKCGIMDQLIIAKGLKNHALLLNTVSLESEAVQVHFKDYTWMIMSTNYSRKITDSKYNQRYDECQLILSHLKSKFELRDLCSLSAKKYQDALNIIKDDTLKRRLKHVYTENERTKQAFSALKEHQIELFSNLLNESHVSLKNDYEVSGLHLDTIVEAARLSGAIGARMTGAGFGGCAIALVLSKDIATFKEKVSKIYQEITHIEPSFYNVCITQGVVEL